MMNTKYYRLTTGRIIDEYNLRTAFEITTGLSSISNEAMYSRWKNRIMTLSVEKVMRPCLATIEEIIDCGQIILAMKVYRDLYNTSLPEAREAVYKMAGRSE